MQAAVSATMVLHYYAIEFVLMILIIFTPLPGGSVDPWAYSLTELAILLILLLWAVGQLRDPRPLPRPLPRIAFISLFLFLGLVLVQIIPLPGGMVEIVSPKTYELRQQLQAGGESLKVLPLSFLPFTTKVEFSKWLVLTGLFLFLLHWRGPDKKSAVFHPLIIATIAMGVFESLYGLFVFFGVQHRLLHLEMAEEIYSGMGTFINRNHFAAYLLMVIPLGAGFLYSREIRNLPGERRRLPQFFSFDGKGFLLGFGIIVMILGLLFSASRMAILSLLFSFTLITILFKRSQKEGPVLKKSLWLLLPALLWGASIGLDAVISRFFGSTEDFQMRWMIWDNAFQIVKDFPLWGSGLGTFSQVFPMYRSFPLQAMVTHAENDFLQLALETGLVGLSLLLVLFIVLFVKAVSGIRRLSARDPQRYVGIGALVGILALMLHSQVERNMQIPANAFLYILLWGIALRSSGEKINEGRRIFGTDACIR